MSFATKGLALVFVRDASAVCERVIVGENTRIERINERAFGTLNQ